MTREPWFIDEEADEVLASIDLALSAAEPPSETLGAHCAKLGDRRFGAGRRLLWRLS
jgi:hypothetical protein